MVYRSCSFRRAFSIDEDDINNNIITITTLMRMKRCFSLGGRKKVKGKCE